VKAVTCTRSELQVADRPAPIPGRGQVLIDVQRCGICGSDLHARHHGDELADVLNEAGYEGFMRSHEEIVFGHEFCGAVVAHGPGCRKAHPEGTPVVAVPIRRRGEEVHAIGLSAAAPGAYAEQLVVEESLTVPVPNGLPPEVAVLTEPMAVGWHAVRRGDVGKRQVAVVIGCGPIGLAVICMLKAKGVRTVVASDPSTGRRALAAACGADAVVDPTVESPYEAADANGHLRTVAEATDKALGTVERLHRLRIPWWHVWRAAEGLGVKPKAPVIFECVGVPGVIDEIMLGAPPNARVVVVGVCMQRDHFEPMFGINKELNLQFVLGYSPEEFAGTLRAIADEKIPVEPLLTGRVGVEGVAGAFEELASPEQHAKILVEPWRA
jgi:threonine dehydrogenase-like Zn-dependent dehydrogenase